MLRSSIDYAEILTMAAGNPIEATESKENFGQVGLLRKLPLQRHYED